MLCYCNVLCISSEYTAKSKVRFLLLYFYSYFHIILGSKIDNGLRRSKKDKPFFLHEKVLSSYLKLVWYILYMYNTYIKKCLKNEKV